MEIHSIRMAALQRESRKPGLDRAAQKWQPGQHLGEEGRSLGTSEPNSSWSHVVMSSVWKEVNTLCRKPWVLLISCNLVTFTCLMCLLRHQQMGR